MIIGCKLATTEYGAETFFQSQLVEVMNPIVKSHDLVIYSTAIEINNISALVKHLFCSTSVTDLATKLHIKA